MKFIYSFIIILTFLWETTSYKGLFIVPSGTKSHVTFFDGIIDALLLNGHKITFISSHSSSINSTNIHQIKIDDTNRRSIIGNTFNLNIFTTLQLYSELIPNQCIDTLTNPEVQKALKEEYDYIIVSLFYVHCFLGHFYETQKPLIYAYPNALSQPFSEYFGAPEFSFTPNRIVPLTHPLTFMERVFSTIMNLIGKLYFAHFIERRTETLCREKKLWGPEIPPISELHKLATLAITNNVRSLEAPVKLVPPTILYAGGIHIKPAKPLQQDLEDWINGSGDEGFILFSLGTAVKPSDITHEHLQIILNVFKTLKQRILWKWNAHEMDNVPSNVKLSSWVPQQDVLAHPKLKLFITHGGLFSLLESTFYGVPLLGMPVFVDQMSNVANVVQEGWGLRVKWTELTEDNFRDTILEVLTNTKYREVVKQRSELMKDWPTDPKEEVAYWVNYIVRHKGAKHLQSPFVHLSWYEIYNLDTWLFILIVLLFILLITFYLLRLSLRFCLKLCLKTKHKSE